MSALCGLNHENDGCNRQSYADDYVGGERLVKHYCAYENCLTGSNTPITEALVAPMLRVAIANVAVETMVGSNASHTRFIQAMAQDIPCVNAVAAVMLRTKNTAAPTERA